MMEFSCKLEYALLALMELATHFDRQAVVGIPEIAAKQSIPERYLDQILAELKRAGITKSYRGAKGGYTLSRSARQISLLDVFVALESAPTPLVGDMVNSNPEKVIVQRTWEKINQQMQGILKGITIEDLCQQRLQYEYSKLMYYI